MAGILERLWQGERVKLKDRKKPMSHNQYRIPRQTDRSLLSALRTLRDSIKSQRNVAVFANPYFGSGELRLDIEEPEKHAGVLAAVKEESAIMPTLGLVDLANNQYAVIIRRETERTTDLLEISSGQFANHLSEDLRAQIIPKLFSLARKLFHAADLEAAFSGGSDSAWERYRDSQQAILSSLQETQKTVVQDFARQRFEAEIAAKKKYDDLEAHLKAEYEKSRKILEDDHEKLLSLVVERETAVSKRESEFNTKESRYVARKQQQEQIDHIKTELSHWSLTDKTRYKRWWVTGSYLAGIGLSGYLAVWYSVQNIDLLKGKDLSQVVWWQWMALSIRSIVPVAACISFIIYFIRWSGSWAKQHADEEFRNRVRVLDIGRSAWLLEAVRDAQENDHTLPTELLKELSRNLFSLSVENVAEEVYPEALTDVVLKGLSSIRIKTPDGSEVEAKREKKK